MALACVVFSGFAAGSEFPFNFDPETRKWDLSNGIVSVSLQLTSRGTFELISLSDRRTQKEWKPPADTAVSPIRFRLDQKLYDANTAFELVHQAAETTSTRGRQVIVLQEPSGATQVSIELEMYAGQAVLRHRVTVTNLRGSTAYVTMADMLPYSFAATGTHRILQVSQWAILPEPREFETKTSILRPDGPAVQLQTGSRGVECAWFAIRDSANFGLFAGWEFDGRATATIRQLSSGALRLSATVNELNSPVEPGGQFEIPGAFLGLYRGDFDEAGYRTQRFVEQVLAPPAPAEFPYVSYDSWGWGQDISEEKLRKEAELAASLGVELFVVDLGWARSIGDWRENPALFPSGLRAFSDFVHSLGMKFGLHFAFSEASAESPVLQANPDWATPNPYFYYGAESLCLANKPARDWLIEEGVRLIDDYNVDWMLQDGENMVKFCDKTTHTHDPGDSNYANAVHGVNAIVEGIRRLRPNVHWENCEDGGNMMTFKMVQNYVTSITADANGALGSRKSVYGATYPFPTRYADRYMPETPESSYWTRSYMFGGPWHLMMRLSELTFDQVDLLKREIEIYKSIRGHIREGKVYHLAPVGDGQIDAIESYHPERDSAVAIVTRELAENSFADIRLRGLKQDRTYRVSFQDDSRVLSMTGLQLIRDGVRVYLPAPRSAEIVYVEPLE